MTLVSWTTDYQGWLTDYGRWPRHIGRWPKFDFFFKWTIPFKCSEMILNYKGKTIDEVNRMEGDLHTTEDDLQTTEDDEGMMEDDQNFHLQTKPL